MDFASKLVKECEDCVLEAYPDTEGVWTIGWGHTGEEVVAGLIWDQDQADRQLAADLYRAQTLAQRIPGFADCNDVRKAVLVSMCFQLGSLNLWHHFRGCLAVGNYLGASMEMLNSLWHKQTPKRCEREARMMATGEWCDG